MSLSSGIECGGAAAALVNRWQHEVDGLPDLTIACATGSALAAAVVVSALVGTPVHVDGRSVALQVLLPVAMAASYGVAHRELPAPWRIGDGWVACDFATEEDRQTFSRLLEFLGAAADDPKAVADEAQLWRLPVCAFAERGSQPTDVSVTPLAEIPQGCSSKFRTLVGLDSRHHLPR